MNTYQQTGKFTFPDGTVVAGYSGNGQWKDNPASQDVKDHGPLPRGHYTAVELRLHDPKLGMFAIRLEPDPNNEMFGRSNFFIHGDSIESPGNASDGCIILSHLDRVKLWGSGDHDIEVVA